MCRVHLTCNSFVSIWRRIVLFFLIWLTSLFWRKSGRLCRSLLVRLSSTYTIVTVTWHGKAALLNPWGSHTCLYLLCTLSCSLLHFKISFEVVTQGLCFSFCPPPLRTFCVPLTLVHSLVMGIEYFSTCTIALFRHVFFLVFQSWRRFLMRASITVSFFKVGAFDLGGKTLSLVSRLALSLSHVFLPLSVVLIQLFNVHQSYVSVRFCRINC